MQLAGRRWKYGSAKSNLGLGFNEQAPFSTTLRSEINSGFVLNIRASGDFVVNAVTAEIVEAANACAENLPADVSEFETTGLTPTFMSCRAPHVAQSPVRLECRVESETRLGREGAGAASIFVASISRAYVIKAFYSGRGQIDVPALRLIGRSSVDQYLVADRQFTVLRPNTGDVGT